jgi:HAD superfamily hydrolase (TIGR01509 family)
MIRAVIFDLDGVVVDTEPLWFETYSRVCRGYGFKFTEELDKLVKGRSNASLPITTALGIPEKQTEFSEKIRKIYRTLFDREAKLMPAAFELLRKLKKDYLLGLATSASRARLTFNLEKFPQIKSLLNSAVSGSEVKNGKPKPDIFLLTAKKLKVRPEECLVIEDAESGVAAAKSAGMKVIGLNPGHVTPQDLSKADRVVSSLSEVDLDSFR